MADTISNSFAKESYSCSLVTQGNWKFYSLTLPSEVLSQTCFVSTRDSDPNEGFQRVLDTQRAQEIADYIDQGTAAIPTAIILSAQECANLQYSSKKKTIEFEITPKSFLIIDGQHRVYGFKLAKTSVRVPVIIYSGLSRKEETRLFVDINTKQRPVPPELLLDIKSLADYENEVESFCHELFDCFNSNSDSALLGMMSPSARSTGKISRVTFNAGIKAIYSIFSGKDASEVYYILNCYFKAMIQGMKKIGIESISKPVLFRSIIQVFPLVARMVDGEYTVPRFSDALSPMFRSINATKLKKTNTLKAGYNYLNDCLNKGFVL